MKISRADTSRIAEWWFTVDRQLMAAILVLLGVGLVLSLAASPSVAIRRGFGAYYFVERQIFFAAAGLVIMFAVSLLTPKNVRRFSAALLLAALAGLAAVHVTGAEINGARRWLSIGGHSLQPSEFAKPAFAVVSGWLFAEARERPDMPALPLAIALFALFAGLLVAEPDVGQTLLVSIVWAALFFVSGQSLAAAGVIGVLGALGVVAAYHVFAHVAFRVDHFFAPGGGDLTQVDRAMQSFTEGGFFGRGPGEGTIKTVLPDAHTDFIFAVVAEEYGALACLALVGLFGFIVLRALVRATEEPEAQGRLAIVGLALLFGLQALFNMGVNVGLLPAKGITLPFISAGGSSMLAVSITLGLLLALTRRRAVLHDARTPWPVTGPGRLAARGQGSK